MLNDTEKDPILAIAHKYDATELVLFASALESKQYRDVDLGVKGIPPASFFRFCGELLRKLARPVDVVDLSKPSPFTALIEKEGVRLLVHTAAS